MRPSSGTTLDAVAGSRHLQLPSPSPPCCVAAPYTPVPQVQRDSGASVEEGGPSAGCGSGYARPQPCWPARRPHQEEQEGAARRDKRLDGDREARWSSRERQGAGSQARGDRPGACRVVGVEAPGWPEHQTPQAAPHPARQAHWAGTQGLVGRTWIHPTWDGLCGQAHPPAPLRLPGGGWSPPGPETSPARDSTSRAPSRPDAGPLPRLSHITA